MGRVEPFFKVPRPRDNPKYLDKVRGLSCAACGCRGRSEAHHCKDRPPHDEIGLYRFYPGYGQRSADEDAIPLCRRCHDMYHRNHGEFRRNYGPDYQYIGTTRAALNYEHMEIEF